MGEGALAGVVIGGLLAAGEVHLNGWLHDGLVLLVLQRGAAAVAIGGVVGAAFSLVADFGFDLGMRHGRTASRLVTIAILAGAVVPTVWLLASRPELIFPPLRPGASAVAVMSWTVLGAATSIGAVLVVWRVRVGYARDERTGFVDRRLRPGLAWIGLGLLLIAVAADRVVVPRWAGARAVGHPSVIVISIDTLRADRLGVLGAERPTPFLDRLAGEGALFRNATATAPWTMPSHASIFTSMLPFDSHARWYRAPLLPQRSTLAERFREGGYRTAAFTGGAWVHPDLGYYQGFERFESYDETTPEVTERFFASAAAWARQASPRPYFLFLHTYDAHIPYTHGEYADPSNAGRFPEVVSFEELALIRSEELVPTESERRFVIDMYDGDVAHADRLVGEFVDGLRESGDLADTIVVVLSDHGEDLWDHVAVRSPDHGHSLYEELLHVPLIFWAPERVRAGLQVQTPVSLLDVAPTLLSLSGLQADPQHRGRDLAATLIDGVEPSMQAVFAESVEYGPERFSVRYGDLKVIVAPFPERIVSRVELPVETIEIFDLASDPAETNNLALSPAPPRSEWIAAVYQHALLALGEAPEDGSELEGISDEMRERLRALGYLN